MRLPRVRYTLRRLLVAVALLAVVSLFWAESLKRRATYCRSRAEWHAHEQWRMGQNRGVQLAAARRARDPIVARILDYDAERYRQGVAWHALRERDYRHASWSPWQSIPEFPRDAPWSPIPASFYPAGVDPDDFWITADGRWVTKAQAVGQAPLPSP